METKTKHIVNGIDTDYLRDTIKQIAEDPAKGKTNWKVKTVWDNGTRSDTFVKGYTIGGQYVEKDYTIQIDEPIELGGTNLFANPQEYLLSALNACMMVGYVAASAMEGIVLKKLRIETEGDIDLRGFLGIDPNVSPGYDDLKYTVYIQGNGTPEQFQKVHETVQATSPNYHNIGKPIRLNSKLVVE